MPLDKPTFPGEAEIPLAGATLTSGGCTGAALALDDDPATAAVFGLPPLPASVVVPISGNLCPVLGTASLGPLRDSEWEVYDGSGNLLGYNHLGVNGTSAFNGWSVGYSGDTLGDASQTLHVTVSPAASFNASYVARIIRMNDDGSLSCYSASFTIPAPPRFLRVDFGFDAFISRVRLAYSGPGAGNVGVDYESSLGFHEGLPQPDDIALSYLPSPADGNAHDVIFNPPVLGRGIVFYPDALLPAPSAQTINLYELEVFQDISQGIPTMPKPTVTQARVGCSGAVITPRGGNVATSYPFPQALASTLQSIQALDFGSTSKLAREIGGDTVHQINGYETDREYKGKLSVQRHDYLALQNLQNGTLVVNPANAGTGQAETQYFAPGYTDRNPYFSLVALSANGDPNALFVYPKCKLEGNLSANLERDKTTTFDIDFVLFWDFNYTRQDGTLGGIYEQVFNNGGATALHS